MDVYHDHVRPWDKLYQDMKNALIKAKKADRHHGERDNKTVLATLEKVKNKLPSLDGIIARPSS
ncbi:hypothetical protein ACXPVS_06425 [Pseudomonas sp. Ma2-10]